MEEATDVPTAFTEDAKIHEKKPAHHDAAEPIYIWVGNKALVSLFHITLPRKVQKMKLQPLKKIKKIPFGKMQVAKGKKGG